MNRLKASDVLCGTLEDHGGYLPPYDPELDHDCEELSRQSWPKPGGCAWSLTGALCVLGLLASYVAACIFTAFDESVNPESRRARSTQYEEGPK